MIVIRLMTQGKIGSMFIVAVYVHIVQEGLPMEASAVIQGVELTHKTYYASNKSLKADVSFSIKFGKFCLTA